MKNCAWLILFFAVLPDYGQADSDRRQADTDQRRAKFNYQLFCQGCHGPDGAGRNGVPRIHSEIGVFLKSQAGREYLIKVPGAANAPLKDAELADVMNWTLNQFAGNSLPEQWREYTEHEVAEYRKQPLLEVLEHRKTLLQELSTQ